MYCTIFFCHLTAVGEVVLSRKVWWRHSGINLGLQEILINYVNCVKLW